MPNVLRVFRIEDPTAEYDYHSDLLQRWLVFIISKNDTVRTLKRRVAAEWGVPPQRQRFYGVSSRPLFKYRFDTPQILRSDDAPVFDTLSNLYREGRIKMTNEIGVVFLPADDTSSDGDGDEPRVLREVDAVAERIAAGRANAVEIADDSEDGDDEEEDVGPPQPQRKRPRRTADGDERQQPDGRGDASGRDDGEGDDRAGDIAGAGDDASAIAAANAGRNRGTEEDGEDGQDEEENDDAVEDPAVEAAGADGGTGGDGTRGQLDRGGEEAGDAENEQRTNGGNAGNYDNDVGRHEARRANREDERGNGAAAEALVAVPAAADGVAAAAAENAEPSELRRWLRGIDANGSNSGRYERYTRAFEREFDCCTAVAAAADEPNGLRDIFRACGVNALGDKAILRREISKLQRLE